MIISHRHKFIFFAVPKTATHTIREALRHHKVKGNLASKSRERGLILVLKSQFSQDLETSRVCSGLKQIEQ